MQYTVCVALYHSHEKRSALVTKSKALFMALRIVALLALLASGGLLSTNMGAELGITISIGALGLVGFISLYVSAYFPSRHAKSGLVTMLLSLCFGLAAI